jgi:hypothetical protein
MIQERLLGGRGHRWSLIVLAGLIGCGDAARSTPAPNPLAATIQFRPGEIRLDNPSSPGGTTTPTTIAIEAVAYDGHGEPFTPSETNPLTVEVHGAPPGAITPTTVTLTSGTSFELRYDGSYFADPITLIAWVDRPGEATTARVASTLETPKALGRTQLVHANPVACSYGTRSFTLPTVCNAGKGAQCVDDAILHGLHVYAAVGAEHPAESWDRFAIDTGSTGTVLPKGKLGKNAIGPGAMGTVYYDSSGNIFSGHYYLATVALQLEDGSSVLSPPMQVLAIESSSCAKDSPCRTPPALDLQYLGVGFARDPKSRTDDFTSPADNAFLKIASGPDGAGVSPGYVLSLRSVTLGVTSTAGFATTPLTPSTTVAGDWNPALGCFSFPAIAGQPSFCGNFLLDTGLAEMFLDLAPDLRPERAVAQAPCRGGDGDQLCWYVPENTPMRVTAGDPAQPALSYEFTITVPPTGAAPTFAQWIDQPPVFINTGRRPLIDYHYLFDARCGNVGFEAVE